jgi:glycine cleavage system aminomethyltransferase T
MIALGSLQTEYSQPGTKVQMEITIESVRLNVGATVVKTPFFSPPRKTAVPV